MDVIARKGKLKKRFSKHAWDLLKNKNGWVLEEQSSTQIVSKTAKKVIPPPSGEQKVENIVEPKKEEIVSDLNKAPEFVATPEFAEVIKSNNISKSAIKDKLDAMENVEYKSSANLVTLTNVLAEQLKNNVEELNALFGIEVKKEEEKPGNDL